MDSDTPDISPPQPSQPPTPAPLDAEVAAFLGAPTPRLDIPPKITRAAYKQVAPTSDLFSVVVPIAAGVFMILMLVSPVAPTVLHDKELSANHATAQGIVLSATPETIHVGGKHPHDYTVYRFLFAFTPANTGAAQLLGGNQVRAVCYADTNLWRAAQPVAVEYNPDNAAIARIQGARITPGRDSFGGLVALSVMGLLMAGIGIWLGVRFRKQRALCRQLLETGVVDEFLVVGMKIQRRGKAGNFYNFQLKPANRDDDQHSYFARFTERRQADPVEAVLDAKTTTFGIYDPASTVAKRLVLMVEAWFR